MVGRPSSQRLGNQLADGLMRLGFKPQKLARDLRERPATASTPLVGEGAPEFIAERVSETGCDCSLPTFGGDIKSDLDGFLSVIDGCPRCRLRFPATSRRRPGRERRVRTVGDRRAVCRLVAADLRT